METKDKTPLVELATINARVSSIRANCVADRADKVQVTADYQCANILGSLTFEIPIDEAKTLYVGQKVSINIKLEERR